MFVDVEGIWHTIASVVTELTKVEVPGSAAEAVSGSAAELISVRGTLAQAPGFKTGVRAVPG